MERRNLIIVVVLVAIIGVSAIGVLILPPVSAQATFTEATIGEPLYLDPAVCYETAGGEVISNVYETMVFWKGESSTEVVPWLAESWNVTSDGMTYTFVLRQGIKFTDGSPFNAYVMKWSLDRVVLINDPDGPGWMYGQCVVGAGDYMYNEAFETGNRTAIYEAALAYLNAGGIEVISDYVLRIHINYGGKPYPPFIYIVANTWGAAVSPTYVQAHGGSDADNPATTDPELQSVPNFFHLAPSLLNGMGVIPGAHNEYLDTHAMGTGPFVCVEWTKGTRIVLLRNEYYWGGPDATGLAKLQKVIIQSVPEFDARKLAILTGDADLVYWDPTYANQLINTTTRTILPLPEYGDIRTILDRPTLAITAAGLNMNKTLETVSCTSINGSAPSNAKLNPLQYMAFRQAIEYSFNHEIYIASQNGFGITPNSVIISGIFGYDPSIPTYTFNTTKAALLFDQVGWSGTVNIYYNSGNDARRKACLILKDGVGNASLKTSVADVIIQVNEIAWPDFVLGIQTKKFPIFFVGWLADYPDADNFIITYAHSQMGTYAKRIGYKNTTIDAMLEDAATNTNLVQRQALYTQASMELYKQALYIYLIQPTNFRVYRSWVQGMFYNPIHPGLFFYSYSKV